jgi:hypothetical protein
MDATNGGVPRRRDVFRWSATGALVIRQDGSGRQRVGA